MFTKDDPTEELPPIDQEIPNGEEEPIDPETPLEEPVDEELGEEYQLSLHMFEGESFISLEELAHTLGGPLDIDQDQGTAQLELFNVPYLLIKTVPVVERNGLLIAEEIMPIFKEDGVFVPLSFLSSALEVEYELDQELVSFVITSEVETVYASLLDREFNLADYSADDLIDYLSFLSSPIPGAQISTIDSSLPGAARPYRFGVHEGFDWYTGGSEVLINLNTPVVSIADGVVVRADWDYVEMTAEERDEYVSISRQLQDTPAFILDKFRGRSVWVEYENGVQMRYAHLSRIEDGLYVGQEVKQGDVLGYVGNSGTSYAIAGDTQGGLHLHADLLIYGELFWKYIDTPAEIRRVLQNTLQ